MIRHGFGRCKLEAWWSERFATSKDPRIERTTLPSLLSIIIPYVFRDWWGEESGRHRRVRRGERCLVLNHANGKAAIPMVSARASVKRPVLARVGGGCPPEVAQLARNRHTALMLGDQLRPCVLRSRLVCLTGGIAYAKSRRPCLLVRMDNTFKEVRRRPRSTVDPAPSTDWRSSDAERGKGSTMGVGRVGGVSEHFGSDLSGLVVISES